MKYILLILSIFLYSCNEAPILDTFSEHDEIIEQDLYNKQRELEILRELYVAQQHQDANSSGEDNENLS